MSSKVKSECRSGRKRVRGNSISRVFASPACVLGASVFLGAICVQGVGAQEKKMEYFEQEVSASNPIRSEQVREMDGYIKTLKSDKSRLSALFAPNYSSPKAYEASVSKLREAFKKSIGYPIPGEASKETPVFTQIGEDSLATYFRVKIPVVEGVNADGIYLVPKGLKGRAPLVISMHGGGGSPDVALFHGGANYHDMVRGGVKRGYCVFAPTHLFRAEGFPNDIRNQIDERMRLVGTSLTAVEIAKISRSLDILLKRPEVDPKRVGMVGLSYGGYYTLVTAAVEPRIKAAVSSCYFGVQEFRYAGSELAIPSDFKFNDRFSLFLDSELVAMICPRALEIQAGTKDDDEHREGGVTLAPASKSYYEKLGKTDRFRWVIFEGGHEFHDATAWEFLQKHL